MDTNFKTINATKSISEGFRLAGINWGLNIAFLVVLFMIGGMIGFIPIVSQFYSSLVAPILMFGYGIVAYNYAKNERVEFGDYFKGFNNFGPMVLTTLGMFLASLVAVLPLVFYVLDAMGGFSGIMELITSFSDPTETTEAIERMGESLSELNIPLVIVLALLFLVPTFLFSFSLYFVWYKQSAPTDALKQSMDLVMQNFGQLLLLGFLLILILGASAIPCGIGLLFTLPAAAYANYAAFASVVDVGDNLEKEIADHLLVK